MPLTDVQIRKAQPQAKTFRLTDEKRLYLEVAPNGSKYWRMKYQFAGKEKLLALGVYGEVSLKQAREKRDVARRQLADGIDPALRPPPPCSQSHFSTAYKAVNGESPREVISRLDP